ncbi:helix-turn-helix domain-containing protein [Gracilibacillus alcaliphilus]|uniref:helix-turn-helix domain-containing protein n=1 Tax=Gracilibacillus alcaliphilus TaxID=1401441 RepID=UPI00195D88A9|nr:helix-turn-helix domain-containing protein [Gracilibacillus alcaliphilus]MBM7678124.1 YesN/AraC family two-component response regulator [Gracilibacillus alcaliphilus]
MGNGVLKNFFFNLKYRRLLLNISLSLCALVVIPILFVGLFGNWHSQHTLQKEIDKSSLQVLEQTRRLMDYQLNHIDAMSIQLANNDTLAKAIEMKDLDTIQPLLDHIQYQLREIYINSPYIDSLYVYYKHVNMVQSAITGLQPIDQFEQKDLLTSFNEMTNEKQWFFSDTINLNNPSQNSFPVTLIRPLPLLNEYNTGAIIVNLNKNVLFKSPSAELMREGEEIWMLHPDGTYGFDIKQGISIAPDKLSSVSNQLDKEINNFDDAYMGDNYRFSIVTSPLTGWKYIYLVPTDVLYSHTKVNNWFMLALVSISIIISLCFALIIGKRIYNPIQTLIQIIGAKQNLSEKRLRTSSEREFPFILSAIEEFSKKEEKLKEELQKNLPVMRQNFLTNILHTRTDHHEDQRRKLRDYGINFSDEDYFSSVLIIDNYADFIKKYPEIDQNLYRYFIEKISEEILSEKFNVVCINSDSSDIIIVCNSCQKYNEKELYEIALTAFKTISQQIKKHLDITVSIGIGAYVKQFGHIADSYQAALQALELRAYKGNCSIICSWQFKTEKSMDSTIFKKRREFEQSMIIAVKGADFAKITQTLDEFFVFIRKYENYPFVLAQHIILELLTSLTHESAELGITGTSDEDVELYNKVMQFDTLDQLEAWITKYTQELISLLKEQLNQNHPDISNQIVDYINQNYNKEISLNGIADKLNLDSSYVSRLFKQKTGVKFMEYLISLRIEKAKDLLIHSSLSVKDIGKTVGYNNTHSFIRIFKKNEGLTPGKFREKNNPKELDSKEIY